jgi:ornithine cyclodeaminase
MRAITAAQLVELVPMHEAVELMKAAFAAASAGSTVSPLRTPIAMPDGSGVSLYMPAYVPPTSMTGGDPVPAASGAKIVSVYEGNRARGLPVINAIVVMIDPSTGVPLGLIEGATLTALRTGAVSGAATDLLARPDARRLTIVGAGVQGVTQAAAVAAVRDIERIQVVDVNTDAAASFAERLARWDDAAAAAVSVASDTDKAIAEADIICTATTSTSPVFRDEAVQPGTHINAVGAFTPEMQEIPAETVVRARIVVDVVEAALHEAGDLIQPIRSGLLDESRIQTELGQIVAGQAPGRSAAAEITFFKSVGNAIQDLIVGARALQRAEARGVGRTVELT